MALSRFINRMGEKALPFYQLLRKTNKFEWTNEAQEAFEDLKRLLSTSPVLVTPCEREPLLLYISASNQVVSTVLMVERAEENKVHGVQRPIYYLSEVLTPTKQRYPHYQKLAYSVFMTARRLRHYFQSTQSWWSTTPHLGISSTTPTPLDESRSRESSCLHETLHTRSATRSSRKCSLISSCTGWRTNSPKSQICLISGQCTLMDPNERTGLAQVSY